MSLNDRQIAATHDELATNLALSGQPAADVATALGLSRARVGVALDVAAARPQDVEKARTAAQVWFALVDVDDVTVAAAL